MRVGHVAQHHRHGVDQMLLPFVRHERADVDDHRNAVRQPVLGVQIGRRPMRDLLHIDAVVHHGDAAGGDAVVDQDVANGAGSGNEAVHLAILPLRECVALQVKVDSPRGDDPGTRHRRRERQRQRRHRDRMRIMRVQDRRLPLPDDPRQLPRRGQIDLVHRCQRHQIGSFGRASIQLTLGVGDQHRAMAARPQAEHGQEDLLLSSAPRARGVDVEGEHSSQSFANLRPTYRAFMADTINPGTPSRKPPRSR